MFLGENNNQKLTNSTLTPICLGLHHNTLLLVTFLQQPVVFFSLYEEAKLPVWLFACMSDTAFGGLWRTLPLQYKTFHMQSDPMAYDSKKQNKNTLPKKKKKV